MGSGWRSCGTAPAPVGRRSAAASLRPEALPSRATGEWRHELQPVHPQRDPLAGVGIVLMAASKSMLSTDGRVLGYFSTNPEATNGEAALALGFWERTISRALHRLAARGLLRQERHGRATWKLATTPLAHHALNILRMEATP